MSSRSGSGSSKSRAEDPLIVALEELRDSLAALSFPLSVPEHEAGRDAVTETRGQLEDYVLPRLRAVDAPLLAVVGGSTGSGKSTIVNSLLGREVSRSSALRPTTRQPVLIHAPGEGHWFTDQRILPSLPRVQTVAASQETAPGMGDAALVPVDAETPGPVELHVVESEAVPSGLALLDSPDIDSVVVENRRLAGQLLAAADLWIFVTTAARYADAIPWAMLDDAQRRKIVLAVVLNRVPPGTSGQVRPDFFRELEAHGLGRAPLFVIGEASGPVDLLPNADIAPLRGWLEGLTEDGRARTSVARQTLEGTVATIIDRASTVLPAYEAQLAEITRLQEIISEARNAAGTTIAASLADNQILRGEVLRRWQDVVGTGDVMRKIETGVASVRDRLSTWIRGVDTARRETKTREAIEDSLQAVLVATAENMVSQIRSSFESNASGAGLAMAAEKNLRTRPVREETAGRLVRDWQRAVLDLLRAEGQDKRATARIAALGVNAVGIALMVVVFAQTAGISGGEIAIAGGTAVVAQKVLEAIFGDDAVRRMTTTARKDFLIRAEKYFNEDTQPYEDEIKRLGISTEKRAAAQAAFTQAGKAARGGETAWL
ncbi:Dynamin family protein [Actinobaculum suis]|uniref:Dynamin family protein n=1 Tax=Actinobaculum suis TaxID=1657 RepID=A0A1G7BIK1_9ACTO|nr:dynamin family protein [Actinobaculum suis]MDY5153731.1 dynamin family protein [Actinobaculum suis]SDE26894.1 Dynamin family protein [Actinobaculum suis]